MHICTVWKPASAGGATPADHSKQAKIPDTLIKLNGKRLQNHARNKLELHSVLVTACQNNKKRYYRKTHQNKLQAVNYFPLGPSGPKQMDN